MKRSVLIVVTAVALAALAYTLRDRPPVEVAAPVIAPVQPAPVDDNEDAERRPTANIVLSVLSVDEFTIIRPPEEHSGEGLYQDLRDAVDSIPTVREVEREAIAPSLALPPLPEPTVEDDDEDDPPPDPSA